MEQANRNPCLIDELYNKTMLFPSEEYYLSDDNTEKNNNIRYKINN